MPRRPESGASERKTNHNIQRKLYCDFPKERLTLLSRSKVTRGCARDRRRDDQGQIRVYTASSCVHAISKMNLEVPYATSTTAFAAAPRRVLGRGTELPNPNNANRRR